MRIRRKPEAIISQAAAPAEQLVRNCGNTAICGNTIVYTNPDFQLSPEPPETCPEKVDSTAQF